MVYGRREGWSVLAKMPYTSEISASTPLRLDRASWLDPALAFESAPPKAKRKNPKRVDFTSTSRGLCDAISMVRGFKLQGEDVPIQSVGMGKRGSWVQLGADGWHSRNQAKALERLPEKGSTKIVLGVVRKEPSVYGKRDVAIAYKEAVKDQLSRIHKIKRENRRKLRHAFMKRASESGGIKTLFADLDTDGNGSISLKEFRQGLIKLG
jgi:hypothetical protein